MKLNKIIIASGTIISTAVMVVSCVKDKDKEVAFEPATFTNTASVQVYDATLGSTRNYVYVDALPVTGAPIAYGGAFPSTSAPANFLTTSGFRAFLIRDTLAATTQPPMSFAENFQASAYYTIFMYDTVNAAKQKTVINSIVVPTDTTSRLRFANFAYSPNALTPVDVFSTRLNTTIFTNVATTDVTSYISYDSRRSDTLYLRPTGTATNILNNNGTVATPNYQPLQIIIAPVRKRNYTVVFRGGFRTDLTSAATARTLSLVANY